MSFYASITAGLGRDYATVIFPPASVQVVNTGTRDLYLTPTTGPANSGGGWQMAGGELVPNLGTEGTNAEFDPPLNPPTGQRELEGSERNVDLDRLIVLNNFWPTGAVQDWAYQLQYVGYALWLVRHPSIPTPFRDDMHVFGYPSSVSGVQTSGVRSYASVVRAQILTVSDIPAGPAPSPPVANYTREEATATATTTINFATGAVEFQFTVSVVRNNASVVLGTVRGEGSISSDRSRFSGTLTSSNSSLSGQFAGSFYGPTGQELGLVFGLNGSVPGATPAAEQRIIGALLGK